MKIYHVDRDLNKTLEEQKKELKSQYNDFEYLFADNAYPRKIHFMASGMKGDGPNDS